MEAGRSTKSRLGEGSKVEANYRGRGRWFPGKIKRDRGDGTFDVDYDDGEKETGVAENLIRLLDAPKADVGRGSKARLEEGAKVEANYRGQGKWFSGKIKRDRGDGTFDVDYDDGEQETRVKEELIRLLDGAPKGLTVEAGRSTKSRVHERSAGSPPAAQRRLKGLRGKHPGSYAAEVRRVRGADGASA